MDASSKQSGTRSRLHPLGKIFLISAFVVLLAIIVPALQPARNCGGNNAALSDVRLYCIIAKLAADEAPDQLSHISAAMGERRRELASIADDFWIRPARFLVTPSLNLGTTSGPRRIIIVCDTPFGNVPRPMWGRGTPRYAAGYSDDTVGLITVAEYRALDLSSFRPLDQLLADSSVGQEAGDPIPSDGN